jgi:hypothetical protein
MAIAPKGYRQMSTCASAVGMLWPDLCSTANRRYWGIGALWLAASASSAQKRIFTRASSLSSMPTRGLRMRSAKPVRARAWRLRGSLWKVEHNRSDAIRLPSCCAPANLGRRIGIVGRCIQIAREYVASRDQAGRFEGRAIFLSRAMRIRWPPGSCAASGAQQRLAP